MTDPNIQSRRYNKFFENKGLTVPRLKDRVLRAGGRLPLLCSSGEEKMTSLNCMYLTRVARGMGHMQARSPAESQPARHSSRLGVVRM